MEFDLKWWELLLVGIVWPTAKGAWLWITGRRKRKVDELDGLVKRYAEGVERYEQQAQKLQTLTDLLTDEQIESGKLRRLVAEQSHQLETQSHQLETQTRHIQDLTAKLDALTVQLAAFAQTQSTP